MKIGDHILYKGRQAYIADKWKPHLLNPTLFKSEEVGYAVVTTDDCCTHILCQEDERYMEKI